MDATGEPAPDILVLVDPALGEAAADCEAFARTALHSLYVSIVVTRSASLAMASQYSALLMVSFAKVVEQVMRRRGGGLMAAPRIMRQASRLLQLAP